MTYRALLIAALCALGLCLPVSPAMAQSSEDTSGANQYTEPGIPGAEPEPAPAPEPEPAPAPAPAPTTPPATVAQTDTSLEATPVADTLPRTGLETALIGFVGFMLLAAGLLVRRTPAWQDPSR
jgi:LPXTG-motif cell wall-anchored protein